MYKSHNINKGNTVTIQDKFYTCICHGDRTKVIQPLAHTYSNNLLIMISNIYKSTCRIYSNMWTWWDNLPYIFN